MARENLVNCDHATIYHNDKNPGISWLLEFDESHFGLRNSEETLEFSV